MPGLMREGISPCDKCGQPVDPKNDAVALEAVIHQHMGRPDKALWLAFTASSRHLLPTGDCEGSPSRAQYLEGQPLDPRGEYPLSEMLVEPLRVAYAELQTWGQPEAHPDAITL